MKIENLCMNCMGEKASPDGVCEHCGYDPKEGTVPPHHLAPFVILAGKYLVGNAIGEGGFGITYIGMDLNLEMRVAIKEYYPNGCAIRDNTGNTNTVQSYAGEQQAFFEAGREKFINEAKVLAKCVSLPEIVTVKDFFKENHTAYIVMEFIDGKTLKTYLKEKGGRISAGETLQMMKPVIKSLGEVHKMNLIHRDISPDNIMIRKDGSVKVLDFGGARDYVSANGRSLSIMLKPGYAPEEQYRTHGEQGPWTDIYALCATMYRCITGVIPPEAMERTYRDELRPISSFGVQCPPNVEFAIFKGLSIYKDGRFRSLEELYGTLYQGAGNAGNAGNQWNQGASAASGRPVNSGNSQGRNPQQNQRQVPPQGRNTPPQKPQQSSSKVLPYLIGSLGVVLAIIVLLLVVKYQMDGKDTSTSGSDTVANTADTSTTKDDSVKKDSSGDVGDVEQEPEGGDVQVTFAPEDDTQSGADSTPEEAAQPAVPVVDKIDMGHVESLIGGRGSQTYGGLYIFDLNQDAGRGTSNCEESFPASALITIPILYTAAKKIDNGTLSLDTPAPFEYTYSGGRGTLSSGNNLKNISVDELLKNMLMYSDNNAINTMINVLTLDTINNTCQSAGFTSVNMERKIISSSSPLNNYMSPKDAAMMVKAMYNNAFNVINQDYILSYMRIVDKAGRLGLFMTDELYNNGTFCNQNGIVPDTYSGRYTEAGIVLAGGQAYVIGAMAEGGNADVSASEFSDAATYIHSCMKEG